MGVADSVALHLCLRLLGRLFGVCALCVCHCHSVFGRMSAVGGKEMGSW